MNRALGNRLTENAVFSAARTVGEGFQPPIAHDPETHKLLWKGKHMPMLREAMEGMLQPSC